jgi:hypothetical protein
MNEQTHNKWFLRIGFNWRLFCGAALAKKPPVKTNRRARRYT